MLIICKKQQMHSESLHKIKSKLKPILKNPKIIDVVIFGSSLKGKALPKDIDIAIITNEKNKYNLNGFHVSVISPEEFFTNIPSLATTLLREGYSLKNNKYLAERLKFKPNVIYIYKLNNLNNSKKVMIVRNLRGSKKEKGIVEKYKGEWLSNQVFTIPPESDSIFEKFFMYHKINFERKYLLIH